MEMLAAIFFKPVSVLCLKKAFIEILLRLSYLLFNYLFLSNFFLSFRKQKKNRCNFQFNFGQKHSHNIRHSNVGWKDQGRFIPKLKYMFILHTDGRNRQKKDTYSPKMPNCYYRQHKQKQRSKSKDSWMLNNNVNSSYEYTFTEFIEYIGCYLPLRYKGAYVKKVIFTNQLAKRNT